MRRWQSSGIIRKTWKVIRWKIEDNEIHPQILIRLPPRGIPLSHCFEDFISSMPQAPELYHLFRVGGLKWKRNRWRKGKGCENQPPKGMCGRWGWDKWCRWGWRMNTGKKRDILYIFTSVYLHMTRYMQQSFVPSSSLLPYCLAVLFHLSFF